MGVRLKLSDMTPALRARVENAMCGGRLEHVSLKPTVTSKKRTPNKTESEYNRVYLGGKGLYEAITLRLPGGSRYTPDWVTFDGSQVTLHECKGAYRHASHGRALTAFRECVAAFPCFRFVWAMRENDGWRIKESGGLK